MILLRAAMFETPPPEGWQAQTAAGADAVFPVKPADLMPEYSGAALGARLKELEARWLASGMVLDKDQLLA